MFMDGSNKWVPMDAVLLQDPLPVMGYLARKDLLNHPKFEHVKQLMKDTEKMDEFRQITIYVDADHAHDVVTRRSVTGILVFINGTLVKYISKRQKTVETSSYGSEMVAARIAVQVAIEYRYALRMMGVEIDGPCQMFGDNNSVILNTTLPSSQLKKKHNSIAYHAVREAIAGKIVKFNHISSQKTMRMY